MRGVGTANSPLVAGSADEQPGLRIHPIDAVTLGSGQSEIDGIAGGRAGLEIFKVVDLTSPNGVGLKGRATKHQSLFME